MNRSFKRFLDEEYDEPTFVKRVPKGPKRQEKDAEAKQRQKRRERADEKRGLLEN